MHFRPRLLWWRLFMCFVWADCVWMVGFVWMDYAQTVDVVWVDCVEKYGGDGWGRCLCTHLFRPVKGTFHYFLKNRLARWMASLNWRGLM